MTTAILPAAGLATRLGGVTKELLPVVLRQTDDGLVPVPALVHALETVAAGGIRRAVVVISPDKADLVRRLADGAGLGLDLAWVVQTRPTGLTDAVVSATRWVPGRAVLVLPDAVFEPLGALAAVAEDDADASLAVFPTDRPEDLGPVVHEDGVVLEVLEKPTGPAPANTWGLVGMSAAFQDWLRRRVAEAPDRGGLSVGKHIDAARRDGLSVRALPFPTGSYRDLGTPRGLADWVLG